LRGAKIYGPRSSGPPDSQKEEEGAGGAKNIARILRRKEFAKKDYPSGRRKEEKKAYLDSHLFRFSDIISKI